MSSSGKSFHASENGNFNLKAISVKQPSRSSIGKTKSTNDESGSKNSEQFNCVLCPFVTNYQTNLLRHRREIHGIVGTRGHKSCKYCGHQAQTNDEIILHQQSAHQEILLRAREKFSRERRGSRSDNSHNKKGIPSDMSLFRESVNSETINSSSNGHIEDDSTNQLDLSENGDDDGEFWKESFLDFPSNLVSSESSPINTSTNHRFGLINQSPLESESFLDQHLNNSNLLGTESGRGEEISNPKTPSNSKKRKSQKNASPANEHDDRLAPTKIKRQYNCSECDFQTFNPRQFLYHRRDQHGEKVKIVECPYCQYACQYFQKLQRHILLIHKLTTTTSPPGLSSLNSEKISINGSLTNRKSDSVEKTNDGSGSEFSSATNSEKRDQPNKTIKNQLPLEENDINKNEDDSERVSKKQKKRKKGKLSGVGNSFKCVSCDKEFPRKFGSEKVKFGQQSEINNRCIKCSFLHQKKLSISDQLGPQSANSNSNKNYSQLMEIHRNHLQNFSSSSDGLVNGLFSTENESNPENADYNLNSIDISSSSKQSAGQERDFFQKIIRNKKERLSYDSNDFQDSNLETHDESCGNSINGNEEDLEDFETSSNDSSSSMSYTDNDSRTNDTQEMNGLKPKKKSRYRVYQCNHCDFRCPTPNRFHIHFLQHVNSKPFVCSECGHRSNWEWDVVKHIKMKLLRDPKHSKAKPVLINDSENIDYCKYDQFIVWTDDPTKFSTGSAQFMPAKRVKIVDEDALFEGPNDASSFQANFNGEGYTENITITPDLPFEYNPGSSSLYQSLRDDESNVYTSYRGLSNCMVNNILQPNVRYVSPPLPRPWMKYVRAFKCAYCSFSHHSTMQLISHLSSHAGKKPYKCKHCSFSSNWKDVVMHHLNSRHEKSTKDIVQLLKYSVTNFICRIVELDNSSCLEGSRNIDSDALCGN